jgi:putative addiction module component (TIGR02574 family)
MHGVNEIIDEASLLPADERAKIVDSLLLTLNSPATSENEWLGLAKTRLADLRSGKVKPVSGTQVFQKIRNRFER